MPQPAPSIQDIVESHLCSGCGACAFHYPLTLRMADTLDHGRRPVSSDKNGNACSHCPADAICPSVGLPVLESHKELAGIKELRQSWGTVLEIWEGFSTDDEIRFRGSSGGVTTAVALHEIEQAGKEGVVHVRARQDAPLLNETVVSKDRDSLVQGAGSRYAPASPCDGLEAIASASKPCVFVGKPCDVAGAAKARRQDSELDRNLGLTIAIFCAGTPSLRGTTELAKSLGALNPESIKKIRYRGEGWPGKMAVTYQDPKSGETKTNSVDYASGWGNILQRHRQWRCHVCADHTGEHADLSIGDPWYRPVGKGDPGRSLVLVRTEKGKRALHQAMKDGYLEMERCEPWVLDASQEHLLRTQASVWGRTLVSRLAGVAAPKYPFRRRLALWLSKLSWKQKVSSIFGTYKRVGTKRLRHPESATVLEGQAASLGK